MAAPANNNEFLELVRKSGVADEKRLEAHLQRLRATGGLPGEPGKLAGVLVRDGLLTHFQAEQICQGKWRRFTIGKYRVLEKLGSGGMGQVFLCEHKLMRRRVAVKILPIVKAADQSSLERFYREARAAAALDHPNVVHAYDIDQDEKLHFLVMEYVDGASLQQLVKKSGPLDPVRAAHYICQAALGLDYAFRVGLVHRDIKPGNILVDRSGTVKVLDMGLARFFNDEEDMLTRKYDENVLGTADYLAPEQVDDSHTADIRADVYGLGLTFYFLLTGRSPFGEGTTAQKLIWQKNRQPRAISAFRADVPPGMIAVIDRMIAKDRAQRYQTPAEVAEALAPWTQGEIAPPAEGEIPQLSPAASGTAPGAEPTQVSSPPPGTPTGSGPRKTWQVIGAPPTKPPSGTVPAVGPPTSPAAAPPPTLPARSPRAETPTAPPRPAAAGKPQAVAPGPAEAAEGDVSWEQMAIDTEDPSGKVNTPPGSGPRGRPSSRTRLGSPESRRFWILAVVVAAAALGVLLVAGLVFGWFANLFGGRGDSAKGTLKVSRADGPYHSISEALQKAKPGNRIVLLDAEHREQLRLDGKGLKDVRIEAGDGAEVVWRPPATGSPTQPLLDLGNVQGLRVKGIRFDGENQLDTLLRLRGRCPGVTLEGIRLEGFRKAGLTVLNCTGEAGRPVVVRGLTAQLPTKGDACAVRLYANPKVEPPENDHIHLEGCRFEGTAKQVVRFEGALGADVRFNDVTPKVELPKR
jgi:eukaryotic-like serine/threonine-protein kinase